MTQQDGRHGRGGDQAVGRRRDGGVEEFAGRGRAIEAGERDIDDGVGFFRGTARPDTALMVAYIDEFKDRFRVGPICRVLAASLDCGLVTPRGYRMSRSGPVSRMVARHEAPARDILEIHADSFMAVYGYRKTHAQLLARGWDPAEIGRDQVMNVMRESGIRGVRRGRTPVTTKPARGTGGRPDLVERGFEAEAPNRPHVADVTYVRMASGSFGYTAFAANVFARRIVGWACATAMDTGGYRCRRWNRRYHGPPRMAARTVSCTIPTMARGASASCTPPGSGNSACFPRPARSATRTTTPWPRAPTARTRPSSSGDASSSRI